MRGNEDTVVFNEEVFKLRDIIDITSYDTGIQAWGLADIELAFAGGQVLLVPVVSDAKLELVNTLLVLSRGHAQAVCHVSLLSKIKELRNLLHCPQLR